MGSSGSVGSAGSSTIGAIWVRSGQPNRLGLSNQSGTVGKGHASQVDLATLFDFVRLVRLDQNGLCQWSLEIIRLNRAEMK